MVVGRNQDKRENLGQYKSPQQIWISYIMKYFIADSYSGVIITAFIFGNNVFLIPLS